MRGQSFLMINLSPVSALSISCFILNYILKSGIWKEYESHWIKFSRVACSLSPTGTRECMWLLKDDVSFYLFFPPKQMHFMLWMRELSPFRNWLNKLNQNFVLATSLISPILLNFPLMNAILWAIIHLLQTVQVQVRVVIS